MALISIVLASSLVILSSILASMVVISLKKHINNIIFSLVSFSAGSLIGGALLHLLPEASNTLQNEELFQILLLSFVIFFLIEKVLHWRHCHKAGCKVHSFAYMNLIGDFVHNIIDGLIMSAAFLTNIKLGIITTIAIICHEIPQEIGDFAILIHAGFKTKKAFLINMFISFSILIGAIVGVLISDKISSFTNYLITFAAGGFIYIAAVDLLPEIKKEKKNNKIISSLFLFFSGIIIMYILKLLLE